MAPGIACKLLSTDVEAGVVGMLVRLAPHAQYPRHADAGIEELYLLEGELRIGERRLYPGDYHSAAAGTAGKRVWSERGCTCVLIAGTRDFIE